MTDEAVAAYLAALPDDRRAVMEAVRDLIREAVPDARETIRYRMPGYATTDVICCIAAQKRHYALYICKPALLEAHGVALAGLDCGKGCVRFKRFEDLPRAAIIALLRAAAADPGFEKPGR